MLNFRTHPGEWAICKLSPASLIPAWAAQTKTFLSITRTPAELSLICEANTVPPDVQCQRGWAAIELIGPFPFELTGILASVLHPLAAAGVPILAISTFDTDWVLVPATQLAAAVQALTEAGHNKS